MVVIVAIFKYFESREKGESKFPYVSKKILTEAEVCFYNSLKDIVKDKYYIFSQVQLSSILQIQRGETMWKKYFNKIIQKSVDFVLIDKQTFQTKLVIELDDSTHYQWKRQQRDSFVDQALKTAGVAILHVKEHNLGEAKLEIYKYL